MVNISSKDEPLLNRTTRINTYINTKWQKIETLHTVVRLSPVRSSTSVEQTRGQRHTGRNDLPGRVRGLLSGW